MVIFKRNSKIIEMRNKGVTLKEISVKFKLSEERVRQIVTNETNYCLKHDLSFSHMCELCNYEREWEETFSKMALKDMVNEGKRIAKLKQKKWEVSQKRMYVIIMRNKFSYSFAGLGRLLKKDHSTIMNLYYN